MWNICFFLSDFYNCLVYRLLKYNLLIPLYFETSVWKLFLRLYLFIFKRAGKEGRTSVCGCLSHARPCLETWPATQACPMTGNWTGNSLVCRPVLSPLSHTSQSSVWKLNLYSIQPLRYQSGIQKFLKWDSCNEAFSGSYYLRWLPKTKNKFYTAKLKQLYNVVTYTLQTIIGFLCTPNMPVFNLENLLFLVVFIWRCPVIQFTSVIFNQCAVAFLKHAIPL